MYLYRVYIYYLIHKKKPPIILYFIFVYLICGFIGTIIIQFIFLEGECHINNDFIMKENKISIIIAMIMISFDIILLLNFTYYWQNIIYKSIIDNSSNFNTESNILLFKKFKKQVYLVTFALSITIIDGALALKIDYYFVNIFFILDNLTVCLLCYLYNYIYIYCNAYLYINIDSNGKCFWIFKVL